MECKFSKKVSVSNLEVEMDEGLGDFMWHKSITQIESKNFPNSDKTYNVKNQHENKLNVTEMRMLCWM